MSDEVLVATWTTSPFTAVKRRRYTVEHRVLLEHFPGVGCDVRHEVRCPEYDVDDWTLAEAYEARDHGLQRVASDDRWWSS